MYIYTISVIIVSIIRSAIIIYIYIYIYTISVIIVSIIRSAIIMVVIINNNDDDNDIYCCSDYYCYYQRVPAALRGPSPGRRDAICMKL